MGRNRTKRGKHAKRGKGRGAKRGGDIGAANSAMSLGHLSISKSGAIGVSDILRRPFMTVDFTRHVFNSATNLGGYIYSMNDLVLTNVTAGVGIPTGYFGDVGRSYMVARVLKSRIIVDISNLELVNPLTVCIAPVSDMTTPSTALNFSDLCAIKGAKYRQFGAQNGGRSTGTLSVSCNLIKYIGEQYVQQDEYAMLVPANATAPGTFQTPTYPLYWMIAFYNANGNNTVTTGGLDIFVRLRNVVEFNDVYKVANNGGPPLAVRENDGSISFVDKSRVEEYVRKRDTLAHISSL